MRSIPSRRPVYVLGAGFSKAISAAMSVTNELGLALEGWLSSEIRFDLRTGQTCEDWLTLQVTPLPFLDGFENSKRAADAAHSSCIGRLTRKLRTRSCSRSGSGYAVA